MNRTLTIGIDASWACGDRTGTGNFTLDLVQAMLQEDHQNHYRLFFRSCCPSHNPLYTISADNVTKTVIPSRSTIWRILFGIARSMRRDSVDVFISPAFFLPLFGARKYVVTFFDMSVYLLREEWLRWGALKGFTLMRLLLPLSLRRADHVVAISQATIADLRRLFPSVSARSSVVYPGLNESRLTAGVGESDVTSPATIPFFLYVGGYSPRKNLGRVLTAFARFLKKEGPSARMVVVGQDGGGYRTTRVQPVAARLGIAGLVEFRGHISEGELDRLYREALCLLYPSLKEGFGYPILVAMFRGCPVLTSRSSSCPEIGGDAVLYVDPESEQEIAEGMVALARDHRLRSELAAKGRERARLFSLEEMGRGYLEIAVRLGKESR